MDSNRSEHGHDVQRCLLCVPERDRRAAPHPTACRDDLHDCLHSSAVLAESCGNVRALDYRGAFFGNLLLVNPDIRPNCSAEAADYFRTGRVCSRHCFYDQYGVSTARLVCRASRVALDLLECSDPHAINDLVYLLRYPSTKADAATGL